jgi:hypothetical protein
MPAPPPQTKKAQRRTNLHCRARSTPPGQQPTPAAARAGGCCACAPLTLWAPQAPFGRAPFPASPDPPAAAARRPLLKRWASRAPRRLPPPCGTAPCSGGRPALTGPAPHAAALDRSHTHPACGFPCLPLFSVDQSSCPRPCALAPCPCLRPCAFAPCLASAPPRPRGARAAAPAVCRAPRAPLHRSWRRAPAAVRSAVRPTWCTPASSAQARGAAEGPGSSSCCLARPPPGARAGAARLVRPRATRRRAPSPPPHTPKADRPAAAAAASRRAPLPGPVCLSLSTCFVCSVRG